MSGLELRRNWLWLALGGVLQAFANGNWAVPAAPWLALPLLLRFARTRRSWRGLLPLAVVLIAAATVILWPMLSLELIPPSLRLAVGFVWGLIAFLPFAVDRAIGRRWDGLASTLAFPMALAVLEWLYSLTPEGSWGSLAYTQYGNGPLLQLTAVTGLWGVSFCIAWFAAMLNLAWESGFDLLRIGRAISVYAACLGLVFLGGGARLAFTRTSTPSVTVAAVTNPPDFPTYFDMADRKGPLIQDVRQWDILLEASVRAAEAGASVVVWQEYSLFLAQVSETRFLEAAGRTARAAGIHLVASYGIQPLGDARAPWRNELVWIGPDGLVLGRYAKAHPSTALEPKAIPGKTPPLVVDTAWGRLAAVICTDQDFPNLIRQAGAAGAGLLVVPSAAWPQVVPLHTHMAAFRSVENGFSLLKATGQGVSAAFDPLGRIVASQGGTGIMLATVPVVKLGTPYGRFGDWFAMSCLAGLVLLVAGAMRSQRK